jgi:hypothetical protein
MGSVWIFFGLLPALEREYERYERGKQDGGEVEGKVQEQGVRRYVERVSMVLRYMVWPGVIVILCMGLMSVLVGGF